MKKHLIIIISFMLVVGCYTTHVRQMTDIQLRQEYIKLDNRLVRNQSQRDSRSNRRSYTTTGHVIGETFFSQTKPKGHLFNSFQAGVIRKLQRKLARVRAEMSIRSMP